jgi:hypothetical protein
MNEIHLPMQKDRPLQYYVNEKRQYQKLKNNILLVLAILGICFIMRLNNQDRISNVDESTKQLYFDVPLHDSPLKLVFSHLV